ncbi:hypothetical protein [Mycobacteroides abscessus]|uniref:Uncharacterized protein n=1 Tax=Mycolicibacterium holsaticum TaxID=152142 RepID=A0A1E3RZ05_9MYCO|nr:hypothetical protein [Mycobacteroides abscessus]ODQ95163.1 hypothetical protein BHQ17_06310 [Mycolicibacterium holsaticum]
MGVQRAHEACGCDRRRFGFPIERITHPIQQHDEREIFVEVEFDRFESIGQMSGAVTVVVLVDNEFCVG